MIFEEKFVKTNRFRLLYILYFLQGLLMFNAELMNTVKLKKAEM